MTAKNNERPVEPDFYDGREEGTEEEADFDVTETNAKDGRGSPEEKSE